MTTRKIIAKKVYISSSVASIIDINIPNDVELIESILINSSDENTPTHDKEYAEFSITYPNWESVSLRRMVLTGRSNVKLQKDFIPLNIPTEYINASVKVSIIGSNEISVPSIQVVIYLICKRKKR